MKFVCVYNNMNRQKLLSAAYGSSMFASPHYLQAASSFQQSVSLSGRSGLDLDFSSPEQGQQQESRSKKKKERSDTKRAVTNSHSENKDGGGAGSSSKRSSSRSSNDTEVTSKLTSNSPTGDDEDARDGASLSEDQDIKFEDVCPAAEDSLDKNKYNVNVDNSSDSSMLDD